MQSDCLAAEVESLLEAERRARQANEPETSLSVCKRIFELLRAAGDSTRLLATLAALCGKRGQFHRTTAALVQLGMAAAADIAAESEQRAFVAGLKRLCEKKVFLEVEHARCAMMLARHSEERVEELVAASEVMESVQIETYASMSAREKLEFVLYQMKICVLLDDNAKLLLVSKKVNLKSLEERGFESLRFTFWLFMFRCHFAARNFGDASTALQNAHSALVADASQPIAVDSSLASRLGRFAEPTVLVESAILLKCAEPFSAEKANALAALARAFDSALAANAPLARLVAAFGSRQLTNCRLSDYQISDLYLFASEYEQNGDLSAAVQSQLLQKNLHSASLYYSAVQLNRLSNVFGIEVDAVEDTLCQMIIDGFIEAKIDRRMGTVDFQQRNERAEDVLEKWFENLNRVLDLTDFAVERIQREEIKSEF